MHLYRLDRLFAQHWKHAFSEKGPEGTKIVNDFGSA